jgi:hypothetical protein
MTDFATTMVAGRRDPDAGNKGGHRVAKTEALLPLPGKQWSRLRCL